MSTTQGKAYVPDVLNQFNSIVKYIYDQGGRYFWIHNTGSIGCLPYVLDHVPIADAIQAAGGKYNFNKHIGCAGKIRVHGKDALVGRGCQDPSLWVNWVGVHFTQAANKRVFDQMVDGSLSDPPLP
ncbi:hypothetical protein ACFX13_011824 [Malus domestica]